MKMRHWFLGAAAVVCVGAAGFLALAWHPSISPIEPVAANTFEPALIARGASLAAIGDCNVCHTRQGGEVLAGGLPLPTPFGTIYSTNITPDPNTGIGKWSETAFVRAMRDGVDREGNNLYPAFPFDHFTKVSDEDDRALYAYLMTRKPVSSEARANDLPFPINVRLVLAGWKLLFLHSGAFQPDATQSAEWNRGAYLVDGLGHCGACHTPRNLLGAEKNSEPFSGGDAEGWTAYALNTASPAPVAWGVDNLAHYLSNGWEAHHGVARGPMGPVTANLSAASPDDAKAIATYLTSVMTKGAPQNGVAQAAPPTAVAKPVTVQAAGGQTVPASFDVADKGAVIYATACSSCHDAGRPVPYGGLHLSLSSSMNGPVPVNPINVILYGMPAAAGERGPIMPGFSGALTDAQIADLLTYLRSRFSDQKPWTNIQGQVAAARKGHDTAAQQASNTNGN